MSQPGSRTILLFGAIATGVVAGGLGALCLSGATGGVDERSASPGHDGARAVGPDDSRQQPDRLPGRRALGSSREELAGLEQRVQELEASGPQSTGADAPPLDAPPASFYHERHQQAIREHEVEPTDQTWGPQTAGVVREELNRLGALGRFQVEDVDCRTATCSAVLQWPSRVTAVEGYRWSLQFPLRANCERTIVLPEPTEGGGPVRATLLLDCNSWRADGAALIPEESMPPLPPVSPMSQVAQQAAPAPR